MSYAEKKAAKRNVPCFHVHREPAKGTKLAGSPPRWVCEDCFDTIYNDGR